MGTFFFNANIKSNKHLILQKKKPTLVLNKIQLHSSLFLLVILECRGAVGRALDWGSKGC